MSFRTSPSFAARRSRAATSVGSSPAAGPDAAIGSRAGLPPGFRVVLDPAVRRLDGGSVLVGGSPLAVLRLTTAGRALLDDLAGGAPVPTTVAANGLARRLLDLGLANPRPPEPGPRSAVTVVVPVRDDAVGLSVTLATLDGVERVLVVDDGSVDPDGVPQVVAAAPQPQRVDVIRVDEPLGPGGARERGWRAAATDVVVFLDAGCSPEPGWLDRLGAHLADPSVAAAAPRVRARRRPGAPAWLGGYEEQRSPLDLGPAAAAVRPRSPVPYVPTAALMVRRAALESVGGFDPRLRYGEDVDLVWRLAAAGWTVRYEPDVHVTHPVRPTLGAWARQRFDYGSSAGPLAARHGDAVAPVAVSLWSAAAWGLASLGHPVLGAGMAGASVAALAPRLRSLPRPAVEAARLAGGGHLRAGRLLAEACRRSWWPLVLVAAVRSGRARRVALVTVAPLLLERRADASLPLAGWLALRLLDDLAYGAGVWAGAARARSTAALRPDLTRRWGRRRPAEALTPWAH